MAGERELAERGEDPDPGVSPLLRRQDEDRLGEVHLAGERLHPLRVEPAPVGEDRELVALQRRFGEDVEEDVGQRALLGPDAARRPRRGPRRGGRNRRSSPRNLPCAGASGSGTWSAGTPRRPRSARAGTRRRAGRRPRRTGGRAARRRSARGSPPPGGGRCPAAASSGGPGAVRGRPGRRRR